jgi:hypothetical protein
VGECKRRLSAAAIIASLGVAAPAAAAVVKSSISVSVTVVATCRIVPGQAKGCAPATNPSAVVVPTPQPVVRYTRDPKTGTTIETIEF